MPELSQRLTAALADRYRIERPLGRGGMATVFLADDLKHHRRVAIKVLHPEVAAAIGPERFLREIATVAKLTHPHILPLHDSGVADGLLFYVMPYVEGESLRDRLVREKQLPVEDALRIAREVADALSYAHAHGLVHRDVKPENILLESGHAVVADFGIARAVAAAGGEKLTATGIAVGTPAYMSPEQAAGGRDLDGRSDLYSLGCMLYEMLAGQPPFTGATAESLLHQHLSVSPRPVTELRPAVPPQVAVGLQRVLAKAPADRFPSGMEFVAFLEQAPSSMASAPPGRNAIAVLPFLDLTAEGPHDYFARGLHDELLTQLAKVATLKVISRTSVMGYVGTTKPLKQIAAELGASSIVEGSVQVAGGRLRVNVQLIEAATDEHLWAERYDRTLDDAFAIQSDIAQQVVVAVGGALTGVLRTRLAAAPTPSAEAYRFFLQGEDYRRRPGVLRENYESAAQLYQRAVELDPRFALAHAALAMAHGRIYWYRYDPSPERVARQRASAETALQLAPDLPEAHIAMAFVHGWGRRDWRPALRELQVALEGRPNDAELWSWIALANRRLGNWDRVAEAIEKATELDPRNAHLRLDPAAITWQFMHRYAEAARACDQARSLAPDLHAAAIRRGWALVSWRGELATLRAELDRIPWEAPVGDLGSVAAQRAALLLLGREGDALLRFVQAGQQKVLVGQEFFLPSSLYAAWACELRGDHPAALAAFDSALSLLDSTLKELPDDWRVHAGRGLALAGLGRTHEALHEVGWLQRTKVYREDALSGPAVAEDCARILANAGEPDGALDEIERLLAEPSWLSAYNLILDPRWDPIREHARFKALLVKYADPEKRVVR